LKQRLQDLWGQHTAAIKALLAVLALVVFSVWWFYEPPVTVGPEASESGRVLILMHGHGAAKDDLQPLANELARTATNVRFVLPAGPHAHGSGRTWYPRFTASSQAELDRRMLELRQEARQVVHDAVTELKASGVAPEQIYVGGFSQGATVALDFVMSPEGAELGGLVSLSGGALDLDLAPLAERAKLRAFVSHGGADRVTEPSSSKALVDALQDGGHDVTPVTFPGGHTIAPVVRQSLATFLAEGD
jgi:predicted esterase